MDEELKTLKTKRPYVIDSWAMSNALLKDFRFLRMWPRELFWLKETDHAKGRLVIKKEVAELRWSGVYMLYRGDELYYVGKSTKNLFGRLHDHSNKVTDNYYAHWDHFSAFALEPKASNPSAKLAEIEAILIAAMPRATNKSTPRFERVEIPPRLRTAMVDARRR